MTRKYIVLLVFTLFLTLISAGMYYFGYILHTKNHGGPDPGMAIIICTGIGDFVALGFLADVLYTLFGEDN